MQYDLSSSSWSGDYLDPSSFWICGAPLPATTTRAGHIRNMNACWRKAGPRGPDKAHGPAGPRGSPDAVGIPGDSAVLGQAPYLKRPEVQGWHPLLLDNHLFEDISLRASQAAGKVEQP